MSKQRIKILKSCKGSEDGHSVKSFEPDGGENSDGVYEVEPNLVVAFCDEQKTAERVGLAKVAAAVKDAVTGGGKDKGKKGEGDEPKA